MKEHAIYWLKRDFRLTDNPALTTALEQHETVTPLYILEPSFLRAPETSAFHLHAVTTAIADLRFRLQKHATDLAIIEGETIETLDRLYERQAFKYLYSHEEIGVERTFARDRAVKRWCETKGVIWTELPQTGVFRRLKDRNQRSRLWKKFTLGELLPEPLAVDLRRLRTPAVWQDLTYAPRKPLTMADTGYALSDVQQELVQPVSETAGRITLETFLYDRSIAYRGGISSPLKAFTAGSRLSVHLAWGTITGRYAYQKTQARIQELKQDDAPPNAGRWRSSLTSFLSRLRWRDHFIQRLESESQMEFETLNPAYQNLEYIDDPERFERWTTGYTGWPMVDACVRCLLTTGFVNFRMRAMLTSAACHSLQIHWKKLDHPMARMYTDYEPGIHLSQLQMQASVVGINTIRIYSPTKQIIDQDPEAEFIKQWIPELRDYTAKEIIQHAEDPLLGYPAPLVDWRVSSKEMRNKLWAIRKQPETREIASQVYEKHGSRKGPSSRRRTSTAKSKTSPKATVVSVAG